ncbi:MAG: IS3 family transposase [Pirellulales bacterium]
MLGFARSSFRYKSRCNQRAELRVRLRDLAASRVHYGYQRLWVLLRREGWLVNKKLVHRLYCEEGLGIRRRKPRRRKRVQVREARPPTGQTNESWSMDFMADQLVGGQRFRLLTLVDNHSRESHTAAPRRRCGRRHALLGKQWVFDGRQRPDHALSSPTACLLSASRAPAAILCPSALRAGTALRDPRRRRPHRLRPLRAPPTQGGQLGRPGARAEVHAAGR